MMNPEQQRIAIAEACGWHRCGPYAVGRSGNQRTVFKGIHPYTSMQAELPDYLESLDAMHEAVQILPDMASDDSGADQLGYCEWLAEVCGAKWASNNAYDMWLLAQATASQRAEALLRTIGKWQD